MFRLSFFVSALLGSSVILAIPLNFHHTTNLVNMESSICPVASGPDRFHCSLQRDFPDHPLLREVAQSHSESHFEGDEASEHKLLSEGKGKRI